MNMWLMVSILGYFIFGLVFVLDKVILNKNPDHPVVYAFYSTIFMALALLAAPFFSWYPSFADMALAAGSGIGYGLGLWFLYIGLSKGDTSRINPFNGAMVTIAVLALSFLFLKERIGLTPTAGIIVLIFSSFVLVFGKKSAKTIFHSGFAWAAMSGLCFGLSHVLAKYLFLAHDFWPVLIWTKGLVGLVGLGILCFAGFRKEIFQKKKTSVKKARSFGWTVFLNKFLSVLAVICVQFGMSSGSVTVVNALSGLQYGFMFILILLFSGFVPAFFNEKFNRRELAVEIAALILVIVGSLLVVPSN